MTEEYGNYIVKINNMCNANCCFCADMPEIRKAKDFDYDKLISELEENRKKFNSLIITGGEPTIYPKLIDYIKHAKQVCGYKHVHLTTNGLLLSYSDLAGKLKKVGVDSFIISYLSSDEKMYDAISRIPGSYKMIRKAFKNLFNQESTIKTNTVIHKLNYKELPKITKQLIMSGVDNIQFSFIDPIGSSVKNDKCGLLVNLREVKQYLYDAFLVAERNGFYNIYVENIPVCVIPELVNRISDFSKPDANRDYYNACKMKLDKCKECAYDGMCDGVWKEYVKQLGDDEFIPVVEMIGRDH